MESASPAQHPRTRRVLGGLCANGHRLTRATTYRTREGWLRCGTCIAETAERRRRRLGKKQRFPLPPEPPEKPCRGCGEVLPRERFGRSGTRSDGSPRWHCWCGRCRVKDSNKKKAEARRYQRLSEEAERDNLTAWIVAKVRQLKTDRGMTYAATIAELGISRRSWDSWSTGERRPALSRIGAVTERLTALLAREEML